MSASAEPIALEARGIRVAFGHTLVLDRIDCQWRQGSRTIVLGPNGAGKSTLLDALSGHVLATAGAVFADGREITSSAPVQRARMHLRRSFQIPILPHELSARDMMMLARRRFGGPAGVDVDAAELLTTLGLAPVTDAAIGTLNHAQRKLVEVATVLCAPAPTLLLDEPAAGLGAIEKARLHAALDRFGAGRTLVIVEHDLEFIERLGGEVIFLSGGRIACTGDLAFVRSRAEARDVYF